LIDQSVKAVVTNAYDVSMLVMIS